MKPKNGRGGYEEKLRNSGAQEVEALRRAPSQKKGTAHRGEDLRSGK